jgi:uncharacterized protein (TIGR01777 family)
MWCARYSARWKFPVDFYFDAETLRIFIVVLSVSASLWFIIKMKILVSGATGFIGSALCASLENDGHGVLRLSRGEPKRKGDPSFVQWQPDSGRFDIAQLEKLDGIEAAIHLAGENVIGRWSEERKHRIRDSRVASTHLLCETLAHLPHRPRVLICASAIGYYGHRGSELLREDSASGKGFLAGVCREWEDAADAARGAGIRTVHARIGVVLGKDGGALQKMLLPFKLGLGGPVGSGRQYFSWITLDDLIAAFKFALRDEKISGALNLVAPNPVTNRVFAQTLGRVLRRPAVIPLPAFAARLAMGREAAGETLLISQRVLPEKLLAHHFQFEYSDLEAALRAML